MLWAGETKTSLGSCLIQSSAGLVNMAQYGREQGKNAGILSKKQI